MDLDGLRVVGRVSSPLTDPAAAPKQGDEGAPEAMVEIVAEFEAALRGIEAGDELLVLTWFDRADRDVLAIDGPRLRVADLEALDGTPVLDLKPVLEAVGER